MKKLVLICFVSLTLLPNFCGWSKNFLTPNSNEYIALPQGSSVTLKDVLAQAGYWTASGVNYGQSRKQVKICWIDESNASKPCLNGSGIEGGNETSNPYGWDFWVTEAPNCKCSSSGCLPVNLLNGE